jgi:hypothetical protein
VLAGITKLSNQCKNCLVGRWRNNFSKSLLEVNAGNLGKSPAAPAGLVFDNVAFIIPLFLEGPDTCDDFSAG